jgi:hypothetical protein
MLTEAQRQAEEAVEAMRAARLASMPRTEGHRPRAVRSCGRCRRPFTPHHGETVCGMCGAS